MFYTFGWIFAARLYGRFDVAPEEVGIGFSFLVVRVVFLILAFLIVAGAAVWGLDVLSRRGGARRIPRAIATFIPPLGLVLFLGSLGAFLLDRIGLDGNLYITITGAVVLGVTGSLLGDKVGDWAAGYEDRLPLLSDIFNVIRYAVIVAGLGLLVATPFMAAEYYADWIERTGEMRTPVLPGISGIAVQQLQASSTDGKPLSAELGESECVSVLGSAGGMVVLYEKDTATVSRVAQGRVSLDDPCI